MLISAEHTKLYTVKIRSIYVLVTDLKYQLLAYFILLLYPDMQNLHMDVCISPTVYS